MKTTTGQLAVLVTEGYVAVEGYEGLYMINKAGSVWSLRWAREIKVTTGTYKRVKLTDENNHRRTVDLHRILAEAFIPRVEGCNVVDHWDEDKHNNDLSNLRWTTHRENVTRGTSKERRMKTYLDNAEKNLGHRYEVAQYTLEGELVATYESATQASRELGYDQGTLSKVCNGKKKQAYGFVWSFVKTA